MINPESLFLDSLSDLRGVLKLSTKTHVYNFIRSTVVLRQLLLDGKKSLYATINKPYGLRLKFEVFALDEQMSQGKKMKWVALAPIRFMPTKLLNIHQFLQHAVCSYEEHTYSVQDIIKYGSYIMGGIHFGVPDNKQMKFTEFQESDPFLIQFDTPLAIASLYSIIEITLKGLEPLEKVVKGHTSTGGL